MFFTLLNGAAPPFQGWAINTMDYLNLHSLADANHEPAHELPSTHSAPPLAAAVSNAFAQMGLAKELLAAVHDLNFTQPTEVQLRAIPLALQDNADKPANDLLVSSQTSRHATITTSSHKIQTKKSL